VEIIGHRGASHDAPENTLASINLAWRQGADAAEFDVYLSKDGQIVVIHDRDTKRIAGVDKRVVDQTLDELRQLDVGKWKDAKFAGEKIPTLPEVLKTLPAGKRVAEAKLKMEQTAIISFSAEVVAAAKKELPAIQGYWIVSLKPGKKKPEKIWTADELIAKATEIKADGLDLSADAMITEAFVKKTNAAKLPVYVWTVNDATLAKQMIAAGVVGITTDRPGWLREQLKK
jgi:glycerophosphoryl diester phosphodiesterase